MVVLELFYFVLDLLQHIMLFNFRSTKGTKTKVVENVEGAEALSKWSFTFLTVLLSTGVLNFYILHSMQNEAMTSNVVFNGTTGFFNLMISISNFCWKPISVHEKIKVF